MKVKYSIVTEGPEEEPITLEAAKLYLKVDADDEDELIGLLIQAARETVEEHTGRSLITQSREIKLDCFPRCLHIDLMYGPVQEDTVSVKYRDEEDAEQTLAEEAYWVDTHSPIARIIIKESWPGTRYRPNAVSITYDAGYGDAIEVPGPLILAVKLILGHLYENRQEVVIGNTGHQIPFGAIAIMSPYVIYQDAAQ